MNLKLVRLLGDPVATVGDLYVLDTAISWHTLEDPDRGLLQIQPLSHILSVKVPGATCIPYGHYQVIIDWSNRFQRMMPHILDVPGFEGVRIHPGNTAADTSGCVLLGKIRGHDMISSSLAAFNEFFPMLEEALDGFAKHVWIDVVEYDPTAIEGSFVPV